MEKRTRSQKKKVAKKLGVMIVLLIIYIASIVGAYLTVRRVFGPGGEWENLTPGFTEVGLIFLPGANTFISLIGLVGAIMTWIDSLDIKINYNRFFRIKK